HLTVGDDGGRAHAAPLLHYVEGRVSDPPLQGLCEHRRPRLFYRGGCTITIQPTPKRSATMPKRGEKNVLVSGTCTLPPSPSALKARSASASFATVSDRLKPWKFGFPWQRPSDAITRESPILRHECITLFSAPGGTEPGCGSGHSLYRMSISTSAPMALR